MATEYGETYHPLMRDEFGALQPMDPFESPEVEDERGPDAMETEELASWLYQRINSSTNRDEDEVSSERQETLNYYLGRPYGDEMEGYSQVVTRDVFELVEWALASMVRVFLSAPRIVEFKPSGGEDIQQAEQETEVVHSHMNQVFIQLMHWVRDAFMYPNAYLKIWHDKVPKTSEHTYQGLSVAQVGMLMQDPNVELLSVEPSAMPLDQFVDVRIRHTTYNGKICIRTIPPEEMLVSSEETQLSLDESSFHCHHRIITKSELVEMGYDREWVDELSTSNDIQTWDERANRRYTTDEQFSDDDMLTHQTVDYYECYVKVDWDNDGIDERRKVCAVGSGASVEVVENELIDNQPICVLSTVPQPHRHVGVSLAHSGKWVQRVSSVLTRQMLDNLYRTNRPRQFAAPGVNMEQLESYVPHGIVEVQNVDSVRPEVIQTVVDKILPVLKHFDEEKEAGSGVSRHTMGLDAERLQNTTMGAYVNALGQASQRLELIARTFAETGFSELAMKLRYLIRTHQDIPRTYQINGEWVEVNPESWRDERDVQACVGLGYGSSQEKVAAGMALLDLQKEALAAGLSDASRIYNNLEDILRAMGKRDASMYFIDPRSPEGQRAQEQIEQQKQAKQGEMKQLIDAQMAQESKKSTLKLAELRAKIENDAQKHLEALAKLELEYEVDIAGKGIEASDVSPMGGTTGG